MPIVASSQTTSQTQQNAPLRWILETSDTAYVVGVNRLGQVVLCYWGQKLPHHDDYPTPPDLGEYASFNGAGQRNPEEYPTHSDLKYIEPCLKATFSDGVRDVRLAYQRAILVVEEETLVIVMQDEHYPLKVFLFYRVHAQTNIIERYVEVQNASDTPITLERLFSAQWHLPMSQQYVLTHFTGRWNDEWHLHRDMLTQGVKVLDSRRITSSHHHNPSFLVGEPNTTETQGNCWFGLLEWSGNWKLTAEVTDFDSTRLSMGLNDWDFAHRLAPDTRYVSPSVFIGYTKDGYTSASHALHDMLRARLPHPDIARKVLYNSWEVTLFSVDEASQMRLAEVASALGVELFVMDDGWFKARNSDSAGLGDWTPDPIKFPNGLQPLIQHINALGMDFGLWLEPEMVNPDSDLYRAHPDWILHFPTRKPTLARNQLILNMARTDVQDYLIAHIDALLSENNISFIKWDMNRNATEAGWQTDGEPREVWVRYVEGLYRVWGTLRERHPHVIWQSCSGGGGRADMGILNYADQIWLSDNTEPTRRLPMQKAFPMIYPANTMEAWVTDMGESWLPLAFRFHVSMTGLLGIGANIIQWNDDQRKLAQAHISTYKAIRHIIQFGDVYRLQNAYDGAYSGVQYLTKAKDEGVLFVFRTHIPQPTYPYRLRLRGLLPHVQYRVEGFGTKTGAGWMNTDCVFDLENFESKLIRITLMGD